MIRKLRKKLIAVSMVSLCIVLFCIFGFVGLLNYRKMVSDADHTLSILADNDGTFPEPKNDEPDHAGKLPDAKDPSQPDPSSQDAGSASSASDSSTNSDPSADTDPGNLKNSGKSGKPSDLPESKQPSGNPKDSPELPFESRYFSVLLDSNDASVLSTDTGMIAAVDEDTAAAYATSIFKREKTKGYHRHLRERYPCDLSGLSANAFVLPHTGLYQRKCMSDRYASGFTFDVSAVRLHHQTVYRESRKTETVYHRCRT